MWEKLLDNYATEIDEQGPDYYFENHHDELYLAVVEANRDNFDLAFDDDLADRTYDEMVRRLKRL